MTGSIFVGWQLNMKGGTQTQSKASDTWSLSHGPTPESPGDGRKSLHGDRRSQHETGDDRRSMAFCPTGTVGGTYALPLVVSYAGAGAQPGIGRCACA